MSPLRFRVRRGAHVEDSPAVSLIVLVTRDVTFLERCLRSVRETSSTDIRCEVLVVANGTPSAVLDRLSMRDDVTVIQSPVNLGFATGCNLATRFARGDHLLFINDDVVVTAGWLHGLTRALEEDERTAVVGSKVLLPDGRLQEAGCVLWSDGSTSGVGRGEDASAAAYSGRRVVDYVSFCSALVRRSAWKAVGGFDQRYFPAYYEDVDLCLTLQANGWMVVCEPDSVVHHEEGGSASREFRDFISRRNQRQFVAKWRSTLSTYHRRPADGGRSGAIAAALLMSAKRQRSTIAHGRRALTGTAVSRDDPDASTLIVDKLYEDALVKGEYIQVLEERLAHQRVRDVVRARLTGHLPSRKRQRRTGPQP